MPGENKTNIKSDVGSVPKAYSGGGHGLFFPRTWFASSQCGETGAKLSCQLENDSYALLFLLTSAHAGMCVFACACVQCGATSSYLRPPRHRSVAHKHCVIKPLRVCSHRHDTCCLSLSPLGDTHPQGASLCIFLILPPCGSFQSQGPRSFR